MMNPLSHLPWNFCFIYQGARSMCPERRLAAEAEEVFLLRRPAHDPIPVYLNRDCAVEPEPDGGPVGRPSLRAPRAASA